MTDDNDDVDQQEVKRTDHGVSITTELKRGTGTRDQDKHILKAKGATFDEAAHYHRQGMKYLTGEPPHEGAIADLARRVQPNGDLDGDDDD
jgi:hypothetical protein